MDDSLGHVLVIDDDKGIREMLGLALREAGYRVSLSNGSRLDMHGGDVDVVLLDLRLGATTAHALLAEASSLAGVPIIVMTASPDAERAAAGLPGIAGIIHKPFDLDDVEASIRSAVDATSRASARFPTPPARNAAPTRG